MAQVTSGITVTVTGVDRVAASLERMRQAAGPAQLAVVRELGSRYVTALKAETPRGRGENPGQLLDGYDDSEGGSSAQAAYVVIKNLTPHLKYVLQGRGLVVVSGAGALRFVIDGQVFFRKTVGPAEANNFPPRVRRTMQPEIDRAGPEIARRIIQGYGGR